MPVIARFYGILIKMYFSQSEHGVPHFHAIYGEYNAVFAIDTLEMLFEKTEGHRTPDETAAIDNMLYELRMAYISTQGTGGGQGEAIEAEGARFKVQ